MTSLSSIARSYAQALSELAKDNDKSYLSYLRNLELIIQNQEIVRIIANPEIDRGIVLDIILTLAKNLPLELKNFISLLLNSKRISLFDQIVHQFNDILLARQNKALALIESAFAISDANKLELEKLLSNRFSKTVTANIVINPSLLAGIKISIGDKVIDGSILGRLNNLSAQVYK